MGIVDRIKMICESKGLNISALEKECGLGHGTIRKWDINSPAVNKLLIVANFLQVTIEWIITGKEAAELTLEESELLKLYRIADDRGKRRIRQTAQAEAQELESLISPTGRTGTGS